MELWIVEAKEHEAKEQEAKEHEAKEHEAHYTRNVSILL